MSLITKNGYKFEVLGYPRKGDHLSECVLVILAETTEYLGGPWPPPVDDVGGGIGCTCDDWSPD